MSSLDLLGPPGAPWGLLGPLGASWGFLGPPGASWGLLEPPGASWGFLGSAGVCWGLLGPPGPPGASWDLLGPPGASWSFLAPPWGLLEPLGASWGFLGPPGASWGLLGLPGAPWAPLGPPRGWVAKQPTPYTRHLGQKRRQGVCYRPHRAAGPHHNSPNLLPLAKLEALSFQLTKVPKRGPGAPKGRHSQKHPRTEGAPVRKTPGASRRPDNVQET